MSFSIAERPPLRRGELRVPKSPTTTCLQLYKHLFKQHWPGGKKYSLRFAIFIRSLLPNQHSNGSKLNRTMSNSYSLGKSIHQVRIQPCWAE
jgi:hypothetical protein